MINLSVNKYLLVLFLIASITSVFVLHWFFVGNMMPAQECLSDNCIYSFPQAILQNSGIMLLILIAALFAGSLLAFKLPNIKIKEFVLKSLWEKNADLFYIKFHSWLKILEKRDPQILLLPLA